MKSLKKKTAAAARKGRPAATPQRGPRSISPVVQPARFTLALLNAGDDVLAVWPLVIDTRAAHDGEYNLSQAVQSAELLHEVRDVMRRKGGSR